MKNYVKYTIHTKPRPKSKKKISFNIASEASSVYILSGQKLIETAKNGQFWKDKNWWEMPKLENST